MRRISAIVLFAIALFLGTFSFASADPGGAGSTDTTAAAGTNVTANGSTGVTATSATDTAASTTANPSANNGGSNNGDHRGSSTNGGQNSGDHHDSSLNVTSVTDQYRQIDVGAKGDSVGDSYVFSDKVYLDSGSHQIGTLDGVCTITRLDRAKKAINQLCVVTLTLPNGQIATQGVLRFTAANAHGTFPLAVTGGTGSFEGAKGVAHATFVTNAKTKVSIDLHY